MGLSNYLPNSRISQAGVCTSATRPVSPYEGQVIYETDTDSVYVWNGSSWANIVADSPRNLLYNGEMLVAQRNTTVTNISATGYFTADRWRIESGTNPATYTQSIVSDVPPNSGFSRALNHQCTSAAPSLATTTRFHCNQLLEGFDCQSINSGTNSAKSLWLSFWVKSNVTGTYNAQIVINNSQLSKQYQIQVVDTWQKVVLEFKANTLTTVSFNNSAQVRAIFWLSAGSAWSNGVYNPDWASTSNNNQSAVGNVNLSSAVNNYWRVTGVMLSVGYPAPFEFKSYNQHFHECQRYYQRHPQAGMRGVTNGSFARMGYDLPVEMRTNASVFSNGGTMGFYNGGAAVVAGVGFSAAYNNSPSSVEADISSSGWGIGNAAVFYKGAGHSFVLIADAEL
jgi:hypothetical protein